MSEKLKASGTTPMGEVNVYRVGAEWKATIKVMEPVKAEITIWGKTEDDIKRKVNQFLKCFTFVYKMND